MTNKSTIPAIDVAKRTEILNGVDSWFHGSFSNVHEKNTKKLKNIKDVNINPFLLRYLSKYAYGDDTYQSMSKVIVYTRALGSSPSTTFGNAMRKFCIEKLEGRVTECSDKLADIEYYDYIANRTRWAKLRLGPDNMNARNVTNVKSDFTELSKNPGISGADCVVGVLYGEKGSMNSSFEKLNNSHKVYVGNDFWYRLTGDKEFYAHLAESIESSLEKVNNNVLDSIVKDVALKLKVDPRFVHPE